MARIDCNVTNCSHNKSGVCYADLVGIVGASARQDCETGCGSFLDEKLYSTLTDNTLDHGACQALKCSVATCRYNENDLCALDHIQVDGEDTAIYTQAHCKSFSVR